MNHQNPTLKKAMLEALEKSLGVVSTAAKIVGINRSTHYDWLANDEEYAQAVSDIENPGFRRIKAVQEYRKSKRSQRIFLLKDQRQKTRLY